MTLTWGFNTNNRYSHRFPGELDCGESLGSSVAYVANDKRTRAKAAFTALQDELPAFKAKLAALDRQLTALDARLTALEAMTGHPTE